MSRCTYNSAANNKKNLNCIRRHSSDERRWENRKCWKKNPAGAWISSHSFSLLSFWLFIQINILLLLLFKHKTTLKKYKNSIVCEIFFLLLDDQCLLSFILLLLKFVVKFFSFSVVFFLFAQLSFISHLFIICFTFSPFLFYLFHSRLRDLRLERLNKIISFLVVFIVRLECFFMIHTKKSQNIKFSSFFSSSLRFLTWTTDDDRRKKQFYAPFVLERWEEN